GERNFITVKFLTGLSVRRYPRTVTPISPRQSAPQEGEVPHGRKALRSRRRSSRLARRVPPVEGRALRVAANRQREDSDDETAEHLRVQVVRVREEPRAGPALHQGDQGGRRGRRRARGGGGRS